MVYEGDGDIKIVPNDPSQLFDSAEGAALAYKRETSNGNMEKAHQLGIKLANELLNAPEGAAFFGAGEQDSPEIQYQRPILFAFVMNTVVADLAPNSIVAHSALSAFYDVIGGQQPGLQAKINDPVAYSQYIHSTRTDPDDQRALGRVFAHLCGHQEDPVMERMGHALAYYFSVFCTEQVMKADWIR